MSGINGIAGQVCKHNRWIYIIHLFNIKSFATPPLFNYHHSLAVEVTNSGHGSINIFADTSEKITITT